MRTIDRRAPFLLKGLEQTNEFGDSPGLASAQSLRLRELCRASLQPTQ